MGTGNPFKPVSEEEKKRRAKLKLDHEVALKEVAELNKKCLNDSKFVKYKEKYLKLEELTIEMLKNYQEPDVVKYATTVKIALAKLNQLGFLLHDINIDNRPKGKK